MDPVTAAPRKFTPCASGPLKLELAALLNRHCAENGSNTPDFILAEFMLECLRAFEATTIARERWHGRAGVLDIALNVQDRREDGKK